MPIVARLDVLLALRKMKSRELAARIGITEQNLSVLRSGRARAIRFETLEAICRELQCQPGDVLEFVRDEAGEASPDSAKGDTHAEENQ